MKGKQKNAWISIDIKSPYCSFSMVLGFTHLTIVAVLFSRLVENRGEAGIVEGVFGSFLLLFSVVGLVYGLVGMFLKRERGRSKGMIGLTINSLILLGMIGLIIIGR